MPMTTQSVPHMREPPMAETKTAAEQKAADDKAAAEKTAAEQKTAADKAAAEKLDADVKAAKQAVADAKTPAEKTTAERNLERAEERKAAAKTGKHRGDLARAGESGDADIQRLLAIRQGHELSIQPDPNLAAQREHAEKAIAEIDDQLAERGYTAQ